MRTAFKYPFELFQLQIDFAFFLEKQHNITFNQALFDNTALFVRLVGFSDDLKPDQNHPKWQELLAGLPSVKQAEYFYEGYKQFELSKNSTLSEKS